MSCYVAQEDILGGKERGPVPYFEIVRVKNQKTDVTGPSRVNRQLYNAATGKVDVLHRGENAMSDSHHDHHHEDPSVCYRVALVFLGVIAAIAVLAVFN